MKKLRDLKDWTIHDVQPMSVLLGWRYRSDTRAKKNPAMAKVDSPATAKIDSAGPKTSTFANGSASILANGCDGQLKMCHGSRVYLTQCFYQLV